MAKEHYGSSLHLYIRYKIFASVGWAEGAPCSIRQK